MPRRGRVPEQLDIPLVWEVEPELQPPRRPPDEGRPAIRPNTAPQPGRLVLASLTDAGCALLGWTLSGGLAVFVGATLTPVQLGLTALAGGEVVALVSLGTLWAWRATPGMLLVGLGFASPLELRRAAWVGAAWSLTLPLAGAPWALAHRALERLARAPLTCLPRASV